MTLVDDPPVAFGPPVVFGPPVGAPVALDPPVEHRGETFRFDDVPDFWVALTRASIGATLVIIAAKVVLTLAYGLWSGFPIEMQRVFGVIPQFAFGLGRDRFEHIVRVSWALSCAGAIVWWSVRTVSNLAEHRAIARLSSRETTSVREREELCFAIFAARAQQAGARIGMWVGSLTLLGILVFEYVRKWLIDDIAMPAFPLLAFLVAMVPVAAIVGECAALSSRPELSASDIAGLLHPVDEEQLEPVPALN